MSSLTFRILTRVYRVGSSCYGLTTDFRIAPAFAAASFCRQTFKVHLQLWSPPCFARAAVFLHALPRNFAFVFILLHNLRKVFLCLSVVMFCILVPFSFLTKVPCRTSSPQFATANRMNKSLLVLSCLSTFPSFQLKAQEESIHILQKEFRVLHRFRTASISSMTTSSVMSLFLCLLYNSAVRSSTSVPSS